MWKPSIATTTTLTATVFAWTSFAAATVDPVQAGTIAGGGLLQHEQCPDVPFLAAVSLNELGTGWRITTAAEAITTAPGNGFCGFWQVYPPVPYLLSISSADWDPEAGGCFDHDDMHAACFDGPIRPGTNLVASRFCYLEVGRGPVCLTGDLLLVRAA